MDAVAGVRLELGEAADLVGGQQPIPRGSGRVDGGSVPGAGGTVVAHVPGQPSGEAGRFAADGSQPHTLLLTGGAGGVLDEPQVRLYDLFEVLGGGGGVEPPVGGGGQPQGGGLPAGSAVGGGG
ncbi:hypothetical protein [Streptomyces sp. NPDC017202]|uniref:hypothetical protein n=1 Tax=Streptomyces sp. NPDC017202 TaxID=3364981 RepID=UPI0037A821E5